MTIPASAPTPLTWAEEEVQHGVVLRRYAELADPSFDFDATFARFVAGHPIDVEANDSIRGSRCGEMVARCIGPRPARRCTTARCAMPLRSPCSRRSASGSRGDEFRHYKLFYSTMKRYRDIEGVGRLSRAKVALGRLLESSDDELPYAYHCGAGEPDPL